MTSGLKQIFSCSSCGAQFPKWSGRCLECGTWGTLIAEISDSQTTKKQAALKVAEASGGAKIIDLREIKALSLERLATHVSEIDRVLGGGLVPGSLILLSGEPGIGKSTLATQIACLSGKKGEIIYVSGEESAAQVKNRLDRLGGNFENLKFISETNAERIYAAVLRARPDILIIDSIQTVYSSLLPSEAGGIPQIRATALKFLELAKEHDITVILIGHITKDGQVAGPKSLEHIVDTVLYLETESRHNYCLLRATKNRFGSVNELGVLEMTGQGFLEVKNTGAIFLNGPESAGGSVISCVLEGSRPFLLDIQALVTKTVFGYPQRKASGFDLSRLQVLSAVISKRTKINLNLQDIILNVVGGLKVSDPALDLAACAAMISSALDKEIARDTIILGEVGLGGEVRGVTRLEIRLQEAKRLGFTRAIIPEMEVKSQGLSLIKVKKLSSLIENL